MKKTIQVLKIIFMVLAILTMCCTLAKKAGAESMIQSDRDYIHSIFDSYWNDNEWSTVEDYMDSMPYFIIFKELNGSNYVLYLSPYSTNDYYEARYVNGNATATGVSSVNIIPWLSNSTNENNSWSFGIRYGGLIPYSLGNLQYSSSRGQYGYAIFTTGLVGSYHIGYRVDIYDRDYDASSWNRYWYDSVLHGVSNFSSSAGRYSMYVDYDWTKTNFNACVIRGEYTTENHWEQNVFPVSYSEDSRLKFSTFTLPSGGEYLQTDIRKIVKDFPISDSSHSSVGLYPEEEITLTLTFVDDNDVETTEQFVLNADNSVISSKYIFSTEFEVFGDFSDYKDVYVSACDFTLFGSEQGGSSEQEDYKISCQYYLKQFVSPISPAEIEEPVYDDPTVVPQSEISETIQMLNESSSSAPNAFSGDWVFEQDHPVPPSWADHYDFRVIYSDDNSFVGNLVNSNVWNYYTDNDPNGLDWLTSSFMPRKFVFENSAFSFYDMIIISVYSANVALSPDNLNILVYNNIELQGYIVFYSERFYIHQQAITQQSMLSSLEYIGYNANLYYDYMYDQLQDFELKNLLAMGSLIDYAKKENNLLSTIDLDINNNTADIITAIKNNKFVPDYSSLIAEMELIKSAVLSVPVSVRSDLVYLFMPTYDGISVNFQQYHDDIGILALPFDETKLVYDTMKNNYTGNFEIDVPELKVQGFTLYDGTHFSFNPWSFFDNDKLSSSDGTGLGFVKGLRYFIAFLAIYGSVASTYAHIFRRENTQD